MSNKVTLIAMRDLALENFKCYLDKIPYKSADTQEGIFDIFARTWNTVCDYMCHEEDQIFLLMDKSEFIKDLQNASDSIYFQLIKLRADGCAYVWKEDNHGRLVEVDFVNLCEMMESNFDSIFRDMMTNPHAYKEFFHIVFPCGLFETPLDELPD